MAFSPICRKGPHGGQGKLTMRARRLSDREAVQIGHLTP